MLEIRFDKQMLKEAIKKELKSQGIAVENYSLDVKRAYSKGYEYKVVLIPNETTKPVCGDIGEAES